MVLFIEEEPEEIPDLAMPLEVAEPACKSEDAFTQVATDLNFYSNPRCTLSLPKRDVLRATKQATLLSRFGWRLRSTAGGIGIASADDEFSRSFPVQRLDIFLSHSWHGWWLLKYVTLLLYFNAVPAVFCGMGAGIAVHIFTQVLIRSRAVWEGTFIFNVLVSEENSLSSTRVVCLPVGGFVFYLVLFTWHHIIKRFGLPQKTLFLDKVCIHQTDAARKELGIKSIGAILNNTDTVMIAWDNTYFERLWCVFELAAYKCHHPRGGIIFLPTMLGATIAVFSLAAMLTETFSVLFIRVSKGSAWEVTGQGGYKLLCWGFFSVELVFFMSVARRYGRDFADLSDQLAHFSVHQAKCFCCSNGHKHPTTGEDLACDRELVYGSIAHWHGKGNTEVGLRRFDRLVQNALRKDITSTLGGWALVPYPLALSFSIWDALIHLDILEADNLDTDTKVLLVLTRLFASTPFILAVAVGVGISCPRTPHVDGGSRCIREIKEWLTNIILVWVVITVTGLHSQFRDYMVLSNLLWKEIVVTVIEVLITLLVFHSSGNYLLKKIVQFGKKHLSRVFRFIHLRFFGAVRGRPSAEVIQMNHRTPPTVAWHPSQGSRM